MTKTTGSYKPGAFKPAETPTKTGSSAAKGASSTPSSGSKAGAASGLVKPSKSKDVTSTGKSAAVKTAEKPLGPTPARRAMDGPELAEPTEAEVESEIQQLLNQADDREPPQELTLVGPLV